VGGEDQRKAAFLAAAPKPDGLALEPFGQGGFWISMHTLDNRANWEAFLGQVEQNLAAIQAAPVVVIDLRGASDGDQRNGRRRATGRGPRKSVPPRRPQSAKIPYRVPPATRAYYADIAANLAADPAQAAQAGPVQEIVSKLDAAAAANQPLL